jgi:formylglycine-generating enzyme required for sulfatase activity
MMRFGSISPMAISLMALLLGLGWIPLISQAPPQEKPPAPPEPGCTLNPQGRWEKRVLLAKDVDLVLVHIPAGSFPMGSGEGRGFGEERPKHTVTIAKAFWMSRTVITQAQWKAAGGAPKTPFKGGSYPVDWATWDQAVAFIRLLNQQLRLTGEKSFRLPSEAEWEYACRAGTHTEFSFGDDASRLPDHGWFTRNSGRESHPVGQLRPNPWGLFDMHGNVWQWCQDPWNGNYKSAPPDGSARITGGGFFQQKHVLRGGAWYVNAHWCRSRSRTKMSPDLRFGSTGFRVVANS